MDTLSAGTGSLQGIHSRTEVLTGNWARLRFIHDTFRSTPDRDLQFERRDPSGKSRREQGVGKARVRPATAGASLATAPPRLPTRISFEFERGVRCCDGQSSANVASRCFVVFVQSAVVLYARAHSGLPRVSSRGDGSPGSAQRDTV